MSVGDELRQARQQAGLSREQISQETKIQLAKLEALERGAFERLPEGIYLDGIVRAYARSVGLDGEATVERVRADRAAHAGLAPDALAPPTAAASPSDSATDIVYAIAPSAYTELDSFPAESGVAYDRGPIDTMELRAVDPELHHHADRPQHVAQHRQFPLIMAVIALLAAAGLGGYLFESVRRSAQSSSASGASGASGASSASSASSASGASGASGASSASGDRGGNAAEQTAGTEARLNTRADSTAPEAVTTDTLASRDPRAQRQPSAPPVANDTPAPVVKESAASTTARTAATARTPSTEGPSVPGASGSALGAPAAPGAPGAPGALGAPAAPGAPSAPSAPGAPVPPRDVSGVWTLDTRIESSSYRDYEGLQLGYQLELQQDGSRVTGTGIKTVENGRKLSSTAQTPIVLHGTIEGGRLTLSFSERGLLRSSEGKMILDVNDDGILRGRFSSSAARSVGLVEARRPAG